MVSDPSYYFHTYQWKRGSATFFRLPEQAHRFHSSNAARASAVSYEVPVEDLLATCYPAEGVSRPLRYLFMTDFCGSTLLARALGGLDGLFCYNEPRVFFSLANERRRIELDGRGDRRRWDAAFEVAVRLMSRTFDPDRIALIKDQPGTNYLIGHLLGRVENSAAVFLYSTLADYLKAVFREDRRRAYARDRVMRTFRETIDMPPLAAIDKAGLSDGRIAALHWLIQMYRYLEVSGSQAALKIRSLRSDEFRDHPARVLTAAAGFFGIHTNNQAIAALMQSDIFRRHSKQVGRLYDPEEERRRNDQLEMGHGVEIDDALAWAAAVSRAKPIPPILPNPLMEGTVQ